MQPLIPIESKSMEQPVASRKNSIISPRVLTALIAIPIVALVVWWQDGLLVFPVAVVLALISLRELQVAARSHGTPLVGEVAYPVLLLIMGVLWCFRTGRVTLATVLTTEAQLLWLVPIGLLIWAVVLYPSRRRISLASVALTPLAIYYVGLFAFLPSLRALAHGHELIWLTLLGVWTGDTAAYYVGRAWGRHKLTPLSPGKTREGALASLLATVVTCTSVAIATQLGWQHGIALGLLIGVAAPLGDLAESFWKRELGVKDLGSILPGHGGVLDRCDSLLFAAFVTYIYALWRLPNG